MKFGPVELGQAQGAVLAHSVAVAGGRLRKGRVLNAQDISALAQSGVTEVIVARLDPGDVAEDAAAEALALAVTAGAEGVELSAAFTGRVNVLAGGPGVVRLDAAAIEAVNAVDPMITIATVPDHQQMTAKGMIATIKIISYAVANDALGQAITAAGVGCITLAAPKLRRATLIITEIPGGPGDKGASAIEDRLTALDVTLQDVVRVPHERAALAKALAAADSDLALVLTSSATSDPEDVAPSAVRAAGGHVARFGMPVDPGNLLFIGDLEGMPVIGLPGCARSPALNGADWVLSRVVCGIDVSARDIAAMGVGGLLKEIPTRPQPRRGKAR